MIAIRCEPRALVGLASLLAALSWSAREAPGDEPLDSRRFLDMYRTALGRLQAACNSGEIEGVQSRQWFKAGADRPVRESTLEMAYASDGHREKHVLIRRDLASLPYFERVFLPRSSRILILERIDPARPFYIRWISKPSEAADALTPNDRRDMFARAAYSLGGGFLIPSILDSPSFRIIEIRRVDRDDDSLVRVVFESRPDATNSLPGLDGWLLLDPERDWAVRAHEVRIVWPTSPNSPSIIVSGTVRYPEGATADPFPEEVTLVTRSGDATRSDEERVHFRAKRRSALPPPADALTLTAHGLGDYLWDFQSPPGRGAGLLVVATPVIPFERPEPQKSVDISFELTNSGPTQVRVVGMRIGCAAILPDEDLPSQISPGQSKWFTVKLQAFSAPDAGETRTPLYLYTTASGQAEVELTLVGRRNTEAQ